LLESPSMLQSAQKRSLAMAKKFDLAMIINQYESLFEAVIQNRKSKIVN